MSILKITSENYEEEVLKSDKTVLIDFYADWCGPCRMMSPIMDEIAEEMSDKIKVGKINVDENQDLAMEYGVMSIPTILIIKNGKVENTFVGVRDKSEILGAIGERFLMLLFNSHANNGVNERSYILFF